MTILTIDRMPDGELRVFDKQLSAEVFTYVAAAVFVAALQSGATQETILDCVRAAEVSIPRYVRKPAHA